MARVAHRLGPLLVLGCAVFVAACGSGGPASTEQGAMDDLRSVLSSYNAATPTDVASTGAACARALSGLRAASLLASSPSAGKDFAVRQDVHVAYLAARQGFADCAAGARTMNYVLMARGDTELTGANKSLQKARSPSG